MTPLKETVVGEVRAALWLLFGSAGFVFLIACANVAGLMLVRAEHRLGELAVRTALGASRSDIARHLLAEALLLAVLGGALGVLAADAAVSALVAFGPENLPRLHEVSVDARVLAAAGGICVVAVLVLGAVPMLRLRRPDLATALGAARRSATAGRAPQSVRGALVAAQLGLALTLLAGAALMAQSFWRLRHADAGFDAEGVLTLELNLPTSIYGEYETVAAFWHMLLERVRAIPGVQAAGAASGLPLSGFAWSVEATLAAEEAEAGDDDAPPVTVQSVTPGYFEALRIPLIAGQALTHGDRADASNPVLVSAALARRLFPDGGAVGRRVRRAGVENAPWLTVAGVVGDVPREAVSDGGAEVLYIAVLDRFIDVLWPNYMSLAVRTSLPPLSLVPAVRQAVRELDPKLAVSNVRTMERIVAASTARETLATVLLVCGAAVALFLGAVVVMLGAVALLASYLPARRAGRVDPIEALRME